MLGFHRATHDFIKDARLRLDLFAKVWYNGVKKGGETMNTQIYNKDNFMEMDPMHDSNASKIEVINSALIITYDGLDQGV